MTVAKNALGTRTNLATAAAAIASLANGAFNTLGTITHASSGKVPLDCKVEISITPGTTAGNKQALLYAQVSLDGSVFTTGPATGTSRTDETELVFLGYVPLYTAGTIQRQVFSLALQNAGILPFATKLIVFNDSGAAFTSGDVYYQDINGDLT